MLADELQNLIMLDNMYSWLEAKLFQLKMSELKEAKFKSLFPERGQSFCEKSLWSESSQDWGHKFCNLFPVLIQICVRERANMRSTSKPFYYLRGKGLFLCLWDTANQI